MQKPLFDQTDTTTRPLAEKMRPKDLKTMHGQRHLLGKEAPLRQMIDADSYSSMILWGPPGCGKTSIARIIESRTKQVFASYSAVLGKTAEIKALMQKAEQIHRQRAGQTLVFVDEIHRFNKAQQDAFLPFIESGAIVLIGATTENPSFALIPALLSRSHLFVLEPLADRDLIQIINRVLPRLGKRLEFDRQVITDIAERAGGDARKAFNDLELISQNAETAETIDRQAAERLLSQRAYFYDKGGEEHFNLISALQKSIRKSDPQAALYWLARMVIAGEDPLYIVRRLVRIASEDVGLADPQALIQAMAVKEAIHFLGMPEADCALCQLTVYLATAPKSNALTQAIAGAKNDAEKTSHLKVPLALRNAPTRTMKDLGYGAGYRYDHDSEDNYYYQKCFPDQMAEKTYYKASRFGFEKEVEKRIAWWKKLRLKQAAHGKEAAGGGKGSSKD